MISVSTPGRICLLGEHQDYLGLPVISMAISLRSKITGQKNNSQIIIIHKPDINKIESFNLDDINYSKPRDYFKSGLKVCQDEGINFSQGFECELTSTIPIQAGMSSSSAIVVSWIHFLSKIADNPPNWSTEKIGELAYKAEVLEFSEPGGMMDQYSTAIGGLIYLEFNPKFKIENFTSNLGTFVIGDSQQPKETIKILKRCKTQRISIFRKLKKMNPTFNLKDVSLDEIKDYNLTNNEFSLLDGTLKNRNFLCLGKNELSNNRPSKRNIGNLLTKHHIILRDRLKISTPKIEKLIRVSLNAGAFGAKINGSGGGGCMFAYAPQNPEIVLNAINNAGGKGYIVNSDNGTTEIK